MKKQMLLKAALVLALAPSVSACASKPVHYCPSYPEVTPAVGEWIIGLYDKFEQGEASQLEVELLYREDALFKLQDALLLCR